MDNTRKKALINLILLAVTLAVNAMGAFGIIAGNSQQEVSDRFPTLITPSSFTFSIWSVIYGLLILALLYMFLRYKEPYYHRAIEELSGLIRVSFIMNMLWIVTFSLVLIEISVLFIFLYVLALAMILTKLLKINDGRRWLLPLAFGLNTGWLFIATVVNVAAMLVKRGWTDFGFPETIIASITLAVALLLALLVTLRVKNAVFPLPIAWAFFGIYQVHAQEGTGGFATLKMTLLVGVVVLIGLAAITLYQNGFGLIPIRKEGQGEASVRR